MEGLLAPEDVLTKILNGALDRAKAKGKQPSDAGNQK